MLKTIAIATVLISISNVSGLFAQEPPEITETLFVPTLPMASPMPASYWTAPGTVVSYSSPFGPDPMQSLHDPSVLKDLEIVDEQLEKIQQIRQSFSKKTSDLFKNFRDANKDPEQSRELSKLMMDLQKEQTEALTKVLLPHQVDRIKQVSRQIQMNSMGVAGAFQYGNLAADLEITAEQKKQFAKIQQDLHKAIAAKTRDLKDKAKAKALEALTPEQRTKLKEFTGETFVRNNKDWQEHYQRQMKKQKLQLPKGD